MHQGLPGSKFLEQIKKRNVGRVAVLYAVVAWLILEPVHVIFHMLEVPAWANRLVIILLALGFPVALIFAWVYELTPEGIKPTQEVPSGQSMRRQTGRRLDRAIIAVLAVALIYFVADKFWLSGLSAHSAQEIPAAKEGKETEEPKDAPVRAAAPVAQFPKFAPPAHSIAVLPFVNMSADARQDYFSDGLSEELLNSLARIPQLQVAARTSSFSFKGKQVDIADIAHKLNVGSILEGSVRKDGAQVRITVQLINAVTGFHLWSETYDRNLREILKLQSEIANAITKTLQATLLADSSASVELGGTQNPAAFDAYLRGHKLRGEVKDKKLRLEELADYQEAIRLDPQFAKAYVQKAFGLMELAGSASGPAIAEGFAKARATAEKAIVLAPQLAEAHSVLAAVLEATFDFSNALVEHERALSLAPGNAIVLRTSAAFFSRVGRADVAIENARRFVMLDPLNPRASNTVGVIFLDAGRYPEAIGMFNRALELDPNSDSVAVNRGLAYLWNADFEAARKSCSTPPIDWYGNTCLAVVYQRLHRQADADAALAAIKAEQGDSSAFQYAGIYAQWGRTAEALQWLEKAYKLRDSGLLDLQVDHMFDPIRQEPRFKEIQSLLKLPT